MNGIVDMSENSSHDSDTSGGVDPAMSSIRWAFRCGTWRPTEEQWTLAARCVQIEEKKRIGKFHFKKDAKSAMSGRLLMRKVISHCLGIPWNEIRLERTEKGKPFLANEVSPERRHFNFNVSHQGNYAVLAAEPRHHVGVDIMQVEWPRGSGGTKKFFSTMSRQFTQAEWKIIKEPADEYDQISRFYRLWCLKESYVKALGIGIGFNLQRMSFNLKTLSLAPGTVAIDTTVDVDGLGQADWSFQETMLDSQHYVAVALKSRESEADGKDETEQSSCPCPEPASPPADRLFRTLQFDELSEDCIPLHTPDTAYWSNFKSKMERPGVK